MEGGVGVFGYRFHHKDSLPEKTHITAHWDLQACVISIWTRATLESPFGGQLANICCTMGILLGGIFL